MDYPKSVPGVGLVGGKFVDENAATGQQGSLIPSVWGNAVTEEISNVIKDAGEVPEEGDLSQLQKAIRKIVALVWPKASDVEVAAGMVDDKVVTPKKLRAGFNASLGLNGFIAFPSWFLGFVIQWGRHVAAANSTATVTLPTSFPNEFFGVLVGPLDSEAFAASLPFSAGLPITKGTFSLRSYYSASSMTNFYIALGR